MSDDSWVCSACGQRNKAIDRTCAFCRGGTTFRFEKSKPVERKTVDPATIIFPVAIPEVRFNLPLKAGAQWTSGDIRVTEKGIFVLSAADKVDPAALADPDASAMIAPLSAYVVKEGIKRVLNSKTLGQAIETTTIRIPLRLTPDGWAMLEAACRKAGMPWQQ